MVAEDSPQVPRASRGVGVGFFLLLFSLAIFSRVFTTNSLAGEPTPDEYLYGVYARDVAAELLTGQWFPVSALADEGRSVVVETALFSAAIPWDQITLGRALQALWNALCIPLTYLLARQIGSTRGASFGAALLLLAAPEFQELGWRFWTDSQATFCGLLFLSALAGYLFRGPNPLRALLTLLSFALLLLTKESAAVTFAPFSVLLVVPLVRQLQSTAARVVAASTVGLVLLVVTVVVLRSADASQLGLLQRTIGAAPLLLAGLGTAVRTIPAYARQVASLTGATQLGLGFTWALVAGFAALLTHLVLALYPGQNRRWHAAGWALATLAWLPAGFLGLRSALDAPSSQPAVILLAIILLVVIAQLGMLLRDARAVPWGLLFLGTALLLYVAGRAAVEAAPKVGGSAALTFRTFMPIIPLLAVLAATGIWESAAAWRLIARGDRVGHAALSMLAAVALILLWSPLWERSSSQALLGRVADRGADPTTPQGLRVEVLVQAEPWLRANLRADDRIVTGIPRQLAWYAGFGTEGLNSLIDLGSQLRNQQDRRSFIQARSGPTGVDYVVDFNVGWLQPDSDDSREWRATVDWISGQPNLEIVYLQRDRFGNPVFYVARNDGYAIPLTKLPAH